MRRLWLGPACILLALTAVMTGNSSLGQPSGSLLRDGGFAAHTKEKGQPGAWQPFAHEGRYTVAIDKSGGRNGGPCLKVEGKAETPDGRAGAFQKTPVFDAPKGLRFRVWTKGQNVKRAVVIQYFDAQAPGKIQEVSRLPIPDNGADYREFSDDVAVPASLREKKIYVHFMLYMYGTGECRWADAELEVLEKFEARLRDVESSPLLVKPNPPEGAVVSQNPPDFRWRPENGARTYTLQLCQRSDFAGPTMLTFEGIHYNCFNLPHALNPGAWFWRYSFVTEAGDRSNWSAIRSFRLPEGVPVFVLPPIAEVRQRIGKDHPRIYVRKADLPAFRRRKEAEAKEWWAGFEKRLEGLLKAEPAPEPVEADLTKLKKPIDLDYFKLDAKLRQASGQVADGLWNLAFGYLISGDRRYADGAKKFLLHVSRWDPKGATSFASNDQVFRDIAIKSAMAYDWIYDNLNSDERALIQKAILVRGNELYRIYAGRQWRVLNFPYDSHGQSNIGYLGLIALAAAGDIPEADEWLDYTVKVYANSFPPWGDADGGWSQGVSYWKWSCFMAFQYADALRSAAGIDLYQKPWFRQNGYFKLYFHPPWCKLSHFGDTGCRGPDTDDAADMGHYAQVYSNPYFQWYAQSIPNRKDGSPYGYFFYDVALKAKPPVDLPPWRFSRDIGWVAMHSALYRPDDVMLFAKASWYGSHSHAHADQNSFVIYAYGEPLAIDSGYYPWFGSEHHVKWAQQTKAHNTILVDGEGQPIQDITAKGEVLDYLGGKAYTYWLGGAAQAYSRRLKRFQRHIVYSPPDRFIIFDDLEATQPATFQWLLHSLNRMEIDAAAKSVLVKSGKARLLVRHLAPGKLTQVQTDQFDVPPEPRGGPYPNQWHYTASTIGKSLSTCFLTLLRVFQERESVADSVELVGSDAILGVRIVSDARESLVLFSEGAAMQHAAGLRFDGRIGAWEALSGDIVRFLLIGGRNLCRGETVLVSTDGPVNLSAGYVNGVFECSVRMPQSVHLGVFMGKAPAFVRMDGAEWDSSKWTFDPKTRMISFDLKGGEHFIQAYSAKPPSPMQGAEFRIGEKIPITGWESAVSANNTQTLWAQFDAPPGVYRARVAGAGAVWINGERLIDGLEVFTRPSNQILIEVEPGFPIPKAGLEPLYAASKAVNAIPVSEDDDRLPGAMKVEAESYAEGIRGTPMIYSHRAFLSGGRGVSTPPVMGIGARWKFEVAKAGRYGLILKVATNEDSAVRAIALDGKPVVAKEGLVRFPSTGGFGGTPNEWKHYLVVNPDGNSALLDLSAGSHTLELVSVEGLLNLDYLLLVLAP